MILTQELVEAINKYQHLVHKKGDKSGRQFASIIEDADPNADPRHILAVKSCVLCIRYYNGGVLTLKLI